VLIAEPQLESLLRCVCYIIPEFPCIFPASREFGISETSSQLTRVAQTVGSS
jgi:hypothetical protein